MTNYLEKFKNLQTEYPQCNSEIKTPNTNQSITLGRHILKPYYLFQANKTQNYKS